MKIRMRTLMTWRLTWTKGPRYQNKGLLNQWTKAETLRGSKWSSKSSSRGGKKSLSRVFWKVQTLKWQEYQSWGRIEKSNHFTVKIKLWLFAKNWVIKYCYWEY